MAKKTEKSADGTSFHGTVINSTINELTRSIGEPQYDAGRYASGFDKTAVEWTCETKDGDVFTIYDWKEGLSNEDDIIEFHIGGHSEEITKRALEELLLVRYLSNDWER
jgi:bacillopeptidase F (M6 metalloprotease family)